VARPNSNAAYCFNWSFGGGYEPSVASLWHESFEIRDGAIVMEGSMRRAAERLEKIAQTPGESREIKRRARSQATRARRLGELLEAAYQDGRPVRVIVNEGHRRAEEDLGRKASIVKARMLDPVSWHVASFDTTTGQLLLRRDDEAASAVPAAVQAAQDLPAAPEFIDQFLIGTMGPAAKVVTTTEAYVRDPLVRAAALLRAEGSCELCGDAGFKTAGGRIYLETHHVVPLSEDGPDHESNVVALCANDHRRAHHGEDAAAIREKLLSMLAQWYEPDATLEG
jgi:5-methylcytosine-specific restriction protein A